MTLEKILDVLKRHPNHSLEINHTPHPYGKEDTDGYEGWTITLYDTEPGKFDQNYIHPHEHVSYKEVLPTIERLVRKLERR